MNLLKLFFASIFYLSWSHTAMAETCGVVAVSANKSNGITISKNVCDSNNKLSKGSIVSLLPNGFLWLKSMDNKTHVICQNNFSQRFEVEINKPTEPWFTSISQDNCNQWKNNKLSCQETKHSGNSFHCGISSLAANNFLETSRNNSVKVRSLGSKNVLKILQANSAALKLCQKMHNIEEKTIKWPIKNNNAYKNCLNNILISLSLDDLSFEFNL